jgi:hypothetical protein
MGNPTKGFPPRGLDRIVRVLSSRTTEYFQRVAIEVVIERNRVKGTRTTEEASRYWLSPTRTKSTSIKTPGKRSHPEVRDALAGGK